MNFFAKHKRIFIISLLGSAMLSPLLSSCGGGTTVAGIGGTGITQGEITAFGSIFVNGIEFDTNTSQFEVDGNINTDQANLSIGMVVTVRGDVDSNGITGTAVSVKYDDEIQGPVAMITAAVNGQRTLTVFNKTVIIDDTSTKFDNTSFASIAVNDIIEISGFDTSATDIDATFVKKTGVYPTDTAIELKGTISGLSVTSFTLAGITINYDINTEIDVPGGSLSDGLFVEVGGDLQTLTTVLAKEIELEDDSFDDGDEVSLQGVISLFNGLADFTVAGQAVDANANPAILFPANATLADGVNVEVEGKIVNGVLIADEVELREGSAGIKAFVTQIDLVNSRIEFQFPPTTGSIFVTTNLQTQFEDGAMGVTNFSLSQLMPGEFVKIVGFENGSEIIASRVKRLNPTGENTEIQGSVGSFTANSSITILGLNFSIDGSENYEPITLPTTIKMGDIVELEDTDPANGVIDKIELEI